MIRGFFQRSRRFFLAASISSASNPPEIETTRTSLATAYDADRFLLEAVRGGLA
jgi:hypothetical protein